MVTTYQTTGMIIHEDNAFFTECTIVGPFNNGTRGNIVHAINQDQETRWSRTQEMGICKSHLFKTQVHGWLVPHDRLTV